MPAREGACYKANHRMLWVERDVERSSSVKHVASTKSLVSYKATHDVVQQIGLGDLRKATEIQTPGRNMLISTPSVVMLDIQESIR